MNINTFRSIAVIISLIFMSGCVGYATPYPRYGVSYGAPRPAVVPYGGYNYRAYPVAPQPYIEHEREHEHEHEWRHEQEWGHGHEGGERGYGHYRRHDD